MITDLKPSITQHLSCVRVMDQVEPVLRVPLLATRGRHCIVTNAAFQLLRKSVIRLESVSFRVRTASS